jgi:hypothetical protein
MSYVNGTYVHPETAVREIFREIGPRAFGGKSVDEAIDYARSFVDLPMPSERDSGRVHREWIYQMLRAVRRLDDRDVT